MDKVFDLHTHTFHSDGELSPEQLIVAAKAMGIDILAITDHDSTAAIADAEELAKQHDIQLIPGVEI